MDRDGGVSIEACERVSRRLGDLLDANPILRGAYHLEVSSAGMNRPIWTLEHFRRFQGETAQVEVVGEGGKNRSVQGTIGPLEGDHLVLVLDGRAGGGSLPGHGAPGAAADGPVEAPVATAGGGRPGRTGID